MQIEKIIAELTRFDHLPADAISAAHAKRKTAAPAFVDEIERFLATDPKERAKPSPLFLILHLLGAWREKSAYRPIARLFQLPTDVLEPVLGDAITATSHRIMAGIFDRDPLPLQSVILHEEADEFIRARMCEALAMVTLQGELPVAETAKILRACFSDIEPQRPHQVWHGWQNAVAMLGLEELRPLAANVFERGLVDPSLATLGDFERNLLLMREQPGTYPPLNDEQYTLLGDVVEELSHWDNLGGR